VINSGINSITSVYYIVSYYKNLLEVQKGLSSGKNTILSQADDRGFCTPRRSFHQSTPHLLSSRAIYRKYGKCEYIKYSASVRNNDMQAYNKKGSTSGSIAEKWHLYLDNY
jgi:hypothetical protein